MDKVNETYHLPLDTMRSLYATEQANEMYHEKKRERGGEKERPIGQEDG